MSTCHRWTCDTDNLSWAAGFDALLDDSRALLAAARSRGTHVGGLGPATPPLLGPTVLALSSHGGGEPLVLHRSDPLPWCPGAVEDGDGLLPDDDRPGLGAVRTTSAAFDELAGAVLLRAVAWGGPAFRLASSVDWTAWTPARELVADVFGVAPAYPFDPTVPVLPA